MGGALTYCHEDGMNYNGILDDLIVGSCPQTAADVDRCLSGRLPEAHNCPFSGKQHHTSNLVKHIQLMRLCIQAC